MIHANSQSNHRIENWVFPNAAARIAAGSYVAADIGKIAYQSDNGSYWRLTATTPTWAGLLGIPAGFSGGYANQNFTNTAFLMSGSGVRFTPTSTGRVLVIFTAAHSNSVAGNYMSAQMRYGTGASPAANAALTGTLFGANSAASSASAGNAGLGTLAMSAIVSGLTVGTTYWFDVQVVVTAGTGSLQSPWFSIMEF